jgi:gamma-glutamylcyclotransferase
MLYFAYGSNLSTAQMRERAPGHRVVGLAALRDHRVEFPRYSPRWAGGVLSVKPHRGDTVWGIVYDVTEPDLASLDQHEGFRADGDQHNVYDRPIVTVELTRPDDGSVPRRLRVWMYVARPSNPSPPSRRYLERVVGGAREHALPEDYVARLSATPVLAEGEETTPAS